MIQASGSRRDLSHETRLDTNRARIATPETRTVGEDRSKRNSCYEYSRTFLYRRFLADTHLHRRKRKRTRAFAHRNRASSLVSKKLADCLPMLLTISSIFLIAYTYASTALHSAVFLLCISRSCLLSLSLIYGILNV